MTPRTVPALLVGALLLGASSACAASSAPGGSAGALPASRAALSPGPTAEPAPATLATPPAPGMVGRRSGPFDDRYELRQTALAGGVASARLVVTSDVSALITVELVADFYDVSGRLLGTSTTVHSEDHGSDPATPDAQAEQNGVPLTVAADPAWRAQVSSVVLSVPTLVNE